MTAAEQLRLVGHVGNDVDGWCGDAEFSPDGVYRYWLTREWRDGDGRAAFVMLNPSTADHALNDPTIRRVCGFVRAWGFRSVTVLNLFALRSTDPRALRKHVNPEGDPKNTDCIREICADAQLVVCAWGAHGTLRGRDREVLSELRATGVSPMALSITKDGYPGHPLYLPATATPRALGGNAP